MLWGGGGCTSAGAMQTTDIDEAAAIIDIDGFVLNAAHPLNYERFL